MNRAGQYDVVRVTRTVAILAAVLVAGGVALSASAQIPLSPRRDAGQSVTPAFEGWYPNPDGSFTLSFGYYNRNTEEIVEIPVGEENFFSPGPADRGQPTEFHPERHWGVFTVVVPADFGDQRLTWTLVNREHTYAIPGHLQPEWILDSKRDPASGNTPPALRWRPNGPAGSGPDGPWTGPLEVKVGEPLTLEVWAEDDGVLRSTFLRQEAPVVLRWFKHRGPGPVRFADAEPAVDDEAGGRAATTASFETAGDYVLRVRAVDYSGLTSGGHSQCCWTNGYVTVSVGE